MVDFVDASGDPWIGVPPSGLRLVSHCIAIAVEHDVCTREQLVNDLNVFIVEGPELDPLCIWLAVAQRALVKLNDR
jgi:hypothetical protein